MQLVGFFDGPNSTGTGLRVGSPVTGTFKQDITPGEEGNYYLTCTETHCGGQGRGDVWLGFGSAENSRMPGGRHGEPGRRHALQLLWLARPRQLCHGPGRKLSGIAPGVLADGYIMHVDYSDGPRISSSTLRRSRWIERDGQGHRSGCSSVLNARSYYAELDVVGAGPVYVTGRLYEFKAAAGGPDPTMVDTMSKTHGRSEDTGEGLHRRPLRYLRPESTRGWRAGRLQMQPGRCVRRFRLHS